MPRHSLLPLPPNTGQSTQTERSGNSSGNRHYVRFYSIRRYRIRTGYARGGLPGGLGQICGYGVSIEEHESGVCVADLQTRREAQAHEWLEAAIMDVDAFLASLEGC